MPRKAVAEGSGLNRGTITRMLRRGVRPRPAHRQRLFEIAVEHAAGELRARRLQYLDRQTRYSRDTSAQRCNEHQHNDVTTRHDRGLTCQQAQWVDADDVLLPCAGRVALERVALERGASLMGRPQLISVVVIAVGDTCGAKLVPTGTMANFRHGPSVEDRRARARERRRREPLLRNAVYIHVPVQLEMTDKEVAGDRGKAACWATTGGRWPPRAVRWGSQAGAVVCAL